MRYRRCGLTRGGLASSVRSGGPGPRRRAQLANTAQRLTATLRDIGLSPGDGVCVLTQESPRCAVVAQAGRELGLSVIALADDLDSRAVIHAIRDCHAQLVIADAMRARALTAVRNQLPALRFAFGGPVFGWSDFADLVWVSARQAIGEE